MLEICCVWRPMWTMITQYSWIPMMMKFMTFLNCEEKHNIVEVQRKNNSPIKHPIHT